KNNKSPLQPRRIEQFTIARVKIHWPVIFAVTLICPSAGVLNEMVSTMTTFCVQNFCKCCLDPAFFGSIAVPKAANFRGVGGDIMRNLASLAATFLIMATAAYSQKSAVSPSANEVSQKDEQ